MSKMLFAAALLAAAFSSHALADDDARCTGVAANAWLSVEAITQKAQAAGYTVREVERDDGCYDVEATDASGKEIDVRFHPGTGEVVETDIDD